MRRTIQNADTINEDRNTGYANVVCVCSYNMIRSPTMAYLLAQEEEPFNIRSAGVEANAVSQLDIYTMSWAHAVVCLDEYVAARVKNDYPDLAGKVISLPTTPGRQYMDHDMVRDMQRKLPELLEKINELYNSSDEVVFDAPAASPANYEQQLGRIKRKKPKRSQVVVKKIGGGRP